MNTEIITDTNMKTSHPTTDTVKNQLGRAQPRWLIFLTCGIGVAVLIKITLVASQIWTSLNVAYDAALT